MDTISLADFTRLITNIRIFVNSIKGRKPGIAQSFAELQTQFQQLERFFLCHDETCLSSSLNACQHRINHQASVLDFYFCNSFACSELIRGFHKLPGCPPLPPTSLPEPTASPLPTVPTQLPLAAPGESPPTPSATAELTLPLPPELSPYSAPLPFLAGGQTALGAAKFQPPSPASGAAPDLGGAAGSTVDTIPSAPAGTGLAEFELPLFAGADSSGLLQPSGTHASPSASQPPTTLAPDISGGSSGPSGHQSATTSATPVPITNTQATGVSAPAAGGVTFGGDFGFTEGTSEPGGGAGAGGSSGALEAVEEEETFIEEEGQVSLPWALAAQPQPPGGGASTTPALWALPESSMPLPQPGQTTSSGSGGGGGEVVGQWPTG